MATPKFLFWRKVEEAQTRVTCFKKPKRCSTRQPCCHGSTKKCSLLARPHALPITSQLRSGERQRNSQSRPQSWPQQSTSTGYQPRGQPSDTDFATPTLKKKCSNSAATPESAPSLAVSTLPRRPHREASTPRRILPGGDGGVMLGRPTDGRQNHGRRRLSGTAEHDPARFLPDTTASDLDGSDVVHVDLNRPMAEIRAELSEYPVKTRACSAARWLSLVISPMQKSKNDLMPANPCLSTCRTTACITPDPQNS